MLRHIVRLIAADDGQDVIEYALMSGVIGIAGLLVFPHIVEKLSDMYSDTITAMNDDALIQPCPPQPAACS
jgi:hypothetical protein